MQTLDDPSRLNGTQRAVQAMAGRASMHAMLQILTILVVDARLLGNLQTNGGEGGTVSLVLLGVSAALKVYLGWLAWSHAGLALREAREHNENIYSRNARGARGVTLICGAVTVGILWLGVRLAL